MRSSSARTRAVASLIGCALALAACATHADQGDVPPNGVRPAAKTFTWGYENEFSSYNVNTPGGATSANMAALNAVLTGFFRYRPDGSVEPNPDFGTYTKVSNQPLTIKYVINPKAVWSDGAPIDCDDFVFAWLANSGTTGTKGFNGGGIAGYQDQERPQCARGSREITVVYRRPFSDWTQMYGPTTIMPAHVVERRAKLTRTFVELAAVPGSAELRPAIDFYAKGWNFRPGQLERDAIPSSGPYRLDIWTAGQSLTLTANPRWWGTAPKIGTIVIRYIPGAAQAEALANGEIQAMDPSPQPDILRQLRGLGDKVRFSTHDALKFEHLDFNFAGAFKDRSLREAFAKCVPRQTIVDNLIKPQNPGAQTMESRFVYPFQPGYGQVAAGSGGRAYDALDIAGSKALLAGRRPVVRIGWDKSSEHPNQRRADTIALIRASCRDAGFTVVDAGTPTFYQKDLFGAGYDVALFSWSQFGSLAGLADQYTTHGAGNPYHYSNRQVDALFAQLGTELDPARRLPLLQQLDTQLWADLATIPLYALPAVLATAPNVEGVQFNATPVDITWNAADWDLR